MAKTATKTNVENMNVENEMTETALAVRSKEASLLFEGDFDKLLESNDFNIRHVVTLKPGQVIGGEFRGEGDGMEFTEPSTGEVRVTKTFVIAVAPRIEAEILGSHQLERKLKNVAIGTKIAIKFVGKNQTRMGRPVNDYLVAKP